MLRDKSTAKARCGRGKKKHIKRNSILLLVKRICKELQKPVHEVMSWPDDELLWWQVFFEMDDGIETPVHKKPKMTTEESIASIKEVFS